MPFRDLADRSVPRIVHALLVVCLVAFGAEQAAFAQTFPTKPVRLIVPYPPGGGTDILARMIGQKLAQAWGQPVVIDNRSGASGTLGVGLAAKAPPDGYTVVIVPTAFGITAALNRSLPYDALRDFSPITALASFPFVLVANPSLDARSVNELIAAAKAKPGQLTYASAGPGSGGHLTMELLKAATGLDILHVPYRGSTPAMIAVVSGEVTMIFEPLSTALLPMVQDNRVRALAVSSATRTELMPGVPTIAEATGIKNVNVTGYFGLLAPVGTPTDVVNQFNSEIGKILMSPEGKERLHAIAVDPWTSTPAEFGAFLKNEVTRWTSVIKAIGLPPQ